MGFSKILNFFENSEIQYLVHILEISHVLLLNLLSRLLPDEFFGCIQLVGDLEKSANSPKNGIKTPKKVRESGFWDLVEVVIFAVGALKEGVDGVHCTRKIG